MAKQSEFRENAEKGDSPFDQSIHQLIAYSLLYDTSEKLTHRDYDDAVRYENVSEVQPQFGLISDDIQRVSYGTHSEPDHVCTQITHG